MNARDNAVQALVNAGYHERQAYELISLVCGEAREAGHRTGRTAALREAADEAASSVDLFPDTHECATAKGALEGLADRFRRMAAKGGKDTPRGESTRPAELRTGSPICTTAAARAAGLDIPPAPAELSAMAGQIVRTTADPHGPEADLARAVPLMLQALAAAQRERDVFRDQRNNVFATNERLLAEREEAQTARLRAENETRRALREPDEARARPAEQRPVNDTLDATRNAAADMLETTTGDRHPMWRVIHTDSESPTGIAPVCNADDSAEHHVIADFPGGPCPDPDGVYDCCPTPQIETDSAPMAAYLVELLNADCEGGED